MRKLGSGSYAAMAATSASVRRNVAASNPSAFARRVAICFVSACSSRETAVKITLPLAMNVSQQFDARARGRERASYVAFSYH